MMKPLGAIACAAAMVGLVPGVQAADPTARPGAPAPAFAAKDIAGRTATLADYAGKTIVLEWTNDGCPFVGKHYNSGNMQELQRRFTAAGDVWLTVASSAPGSTGKNNPESRK